MDKKKKYTGVELMRDAPVGTAIIRLALPMMITMIAQALYNMTDVFFIGQTNDSNMVAAVALASPLFMLSQALGNVFATGGANYISRTLGAKKYDEARHASVVSFYTAFGVGVVLTIILLLFKTPILRLIGVSDATFEHTDDYFTVVSIFMAFATTGAVMSSQVRSEGETKKAMFIMLVGIVLNVIFDPIFILTLDMGTVGAAWATVAGQCVSYFLGLKYFASKHSLLSIHPRDFKPNKEMMRQILSIGIPAGISNIIMSVSNILGNRVLVGYGDYVVAGNGVFMRVAGLFFMFIFAIVMGYQPFAGYNYGANQHDRLRKGFLITVALSTGMCIVGAIILRIFGDSFIWFFIDDHNTIEAGTAILKVFIYGLPFIGAQVTLMVTFQALGKPIRAMIITIGRQLLFYVPLLFILNELFGFDGYTWTQPAADFLTTGIAIALGMSLLKSMRGKEDDEIHKLEV